MFERLFSHGEKEIIRMLLDLVLLHSKGQLAPNSLVAMKQERLATGEVVTVLAIKAIKQDNPDYVVYIPLCEIIVDTSQYMPAPHSETVREWLKNHLGQDYESDNLGFISPFSAN